jgi:hypothetical protein
MSQDLALSGTPAREEWSPFHLAYLLPRVPVEGNDATGALRAQEREVQEFLGTVPGDREQHRYAPGKWSVREVVGHISDTERILSVRSLAAARGDQGIYPMFDEESYTPIAGHDALPLHRLLEQFLAVRRSSLALFSTYDHEAWRRLGNTSGKPVSARAWAWAIWAHTALHMDTLRTRYLL